MFSIFIAMAKQNIYEERYLRLLQNLCFCHYSGIVYRGVDSNQSYVIEALLSDKNNDILMKLLADTGESGDSREKKYSDFGSGIRIPCPWINSENKKLLQEVDNENSINTQNRSNSIFAYDLYKKGLPTLYIKWNHPNTKSNISLSMNELFPQNIYNRSKYMNASDSTSPASNEYYIKLK